MTYTKIVQQQTWKRGKGFGGWALLGGLAVLACLAGGCSDPNAEVPPAKAEPVTAYGMTLDESAGPKEVSYVLLRSLVEDIRASRAMEHEKQKEANQITWSIAAHQTIEQRLLDAVRSAARNKERFKTLGPDRDREIYRVVNFWAAIVQYYVDGIDTDPRKAMEQMRVQAAPDGSVAHVYYDVVPDPANPDPQREATIDIELAKEPAGGKAYWRVARVGFVGGRTRRGALPAGGSTNNPATQPTTQAE